MFVKFGVFYQSEISVQGNAGMCFGKDSAEMHYSGLGGSVIFCALVTRSLNALPACGLRIHRA